MSMGYQIGWRTCLVFGLLIMTTWGCSDNDFASQRKIVAPRVIGASLTPPEVAPNETAHFDLTLASPHDVPFDVHVTWDLCLFTEGPSKFYRCVEELPDVPFDNIIAQGEGASFDFTQDVLSNTMIHAACDALARSAEQMNIPPSIAGSLPKCLTGLPAKLRLKTCFNSQECTDEEGVVSIQTFTFLFADHQQDEDRNKNPFIAGIYLENQLLDPDGHSTLVLKDHTYKYPLRLAVDSQAAAQSFTLPDDEHGPRREDLQSDWYLSDGELSWGRRYYWEGETTDEEFRTNNIALDPNLLEDGQRIDLWVTVRDSRNGQGSVHRSFTVQK